MQHANVQLILFVYCGNVGLGWLWCWLGWTFHMYPMMIRWWWRLRIFIQQSLMTSFHLSIPHSRSLKVYWLTNMLQLKHLFILTSPHNSWISIKFDDNTNAVFIHSSWYKLIIPNLMRMTVYLSIKPSSYNYIAMKQPHLGYNGTR